MFFEKRERWNFFIFFFRNFEGMDKFTYGKEAEISRVSNQNGISRLHIIVEIHHSGQKPSIYFLVNL